MIKKIPKKVIEVLQKLEQADFEANVASGRAKNLTA